MEHYRPTDTSTLKQCPCCDYLSLPERGNYAICPICFWEDEDGIDVDIIDSLDFECGANHGLTLRQGRANFLEFGACERDCLSHVVSLKAREHYIHKPRSL